jgi:hypothetical protein
MYGIYIFINKYIVLYWGCVIISLKTDIGVRDQTNLKTSDIDNEI